MHGLEEVLSLLLVVEKNIAGARRRKESLKGPPFLAREGLQRDLLNGTEKRKTGSSRAGVLLVLRASRTSM